MDFENCIWTVIRFLMYKTVGVFHKKIDLNEWEQLSTFIFMFLIFQPLHFALHVILEIP